MFSFLKELWGGVKLRMAAHKMCKNVNKEFYFEAPKKKTLLTVFGESQIIPANFSEQEREDNAKALIHRLREADIKK